MAYDPFRLSPSIRRLVMLTQREFDGMHMGRATLLIYCGRRSLQEQSRLYRRGRTLKQILAKAEELSDKYNQPELAQILMDVGPQYGKNIVTWAGPGQSLHNYGLAVDSVPLMDGKPVWGTEEKWEQDLWQAYGRIAVGNGLEWAGNWTPGKREYPHIQRAGTHWEDLIRGFDF